MSRAGTMSGWIKAAVGAALLCVCGVACEEESKTVPDTCTELPLYDIQEAGAPADDFKSLPCITPIGHAISSEGDEAGAPSTAGSGGSSGKPSVGSGGDAGAGGGS